MHPEFLRIGKPVGLRFELADISGGHTHPHFNVGSPSELQEAIYDHFPALPLPKNYLTEFQKANKLLGIN